MAHIMRKTKDWSHEEITHLLQVLNKYAIDQQ